MSMPEMRIFCKHFSLEWLPVSKTPKDLLLKEGGKTRVKTY
jgi:hypothetical protein